MNRLICICAALAVTVTPVLGTTILQLIPVDGEVSGNPGDTVGWGFTFTSDTDYALITNTDYCEGAFVSPCSSSLGVYEDYAANNFTVIGPAPDESPVVTEDFDSTMLTGLGAFAIDPGASPGATSTGTVYVEFDLYDDDPNDPNFDPIADLVSTGNVLSDPASVQAPGGTPEPGTSVLLLGALLAGWGFGAKRRSA